MTEATQCNENNVRTELRNWLEENWNPNAKLKEWRTLLAESGWGMPSWPNE